MYINDLNYHLEFDIDIFLILSCFTGKFYVENSSFPQIHSIDWPLGCKPPGSPSSTPNWFGVGAGIVGSIVVDGMESVFPPIAGMLTIFGNIPFNDDSGYLDEYLANLDKCIEKMINERIEEYELDKAKTSYQTLITQISNFRKTFLQNSINEENINLAVVDLGDMDDFVDGVHAQFNAVKKHEKFVDLLIDGLVQESFMKLMFVQRLFEEYDLEKTQTYAQNYLVKMESRRQVYFENSEKTGIKYIIDSSDFANWVNLVKCDRDEPCWDRWWMDGNHIEHWACYGNNNYKAVDEYISKELMSEKRNCNGNCDPLYCPSKAVKLMDEAKDNATAQIHQISEKIQNTYEYFDLLIDRLNEIINAKPKTTTSKPGKN